MPTVTSVETFVLLRFRALNFTRRACSKFGFSIGVVLSNYSLQAALTSHTYSHRQPSAYDMAKPMPRNLTPNGLIKAGLVIAREMLEELR